MQLHELFLPIRLPWYAGTHLPPSIAHWLCFVDLSLVSMHCTGRHMACIAKCCVSSLSLLCWGGEIHVKLQICCCCLSLPPTGFRLHSTCSRCCSLLPAQHFHGHDHDFCVLCFATHPATHLQGFYVLIDHASYLEKDPNMANPALFSANWGNLWRMVTELPGYSQKLRGRVFPGEQAVCE